MNGYSSEVGVQIIVALMKAHGIRRVVASPGSTNICLVASLQSDPYFDIYSSVDERSAAYIACGLAAETGEPVAISCTEATASRNYLSGMTEAFYRKLPVLAITATNDRCLIGQNKPQMIDRSVLPNDVAKKSLRVPIIRTEKEKIGYTNLINDAILELFRNGSGPVHIEYETEYKGDYSVKELPKVNVIQRITPEDSFPKIPEGKIAIYVGAHKRWSPELTKAVDEFCGKYNAVVLADHISNYHGNYGVYPTIVTSQRHYSFPCCEIDTLIYIGDISHSYKKNYKIKKVWRVNPDGEIRNALGALSYVFEMSETAFFKHYDSVAQSDSVHDSYLKMWREECEKLTAKVPELPFSNLWTAQHTVSLLPKDSSLFLGIENTLRSWNFFEAKNHVSGFANTGGFGIDGGVSSLIGASFAHPEKLYFGVTGDLAFFYDMNVLGNRHVGKNVRLIVINNGIGQQFKNPNHPAENLGNDANAYVAAQGHYGNKSTSLLKHYAESLGYEYLSASDKQEFLSIVERFVDPIVGNKSIIFEVFTDTADETEALNMMQTLVVADSAKMKNAVKKVLGNKGIRFIKKAIRFVK